MRAFVKIIIVFFFVVSTCCFYNKVYAQDSQLEYVQIFLTEQGYELGSADGFMGPKTRAAIARFQLENDLNVTGEVNPATLAAIQKATELSAQPKVSDPVISEKNSDSSSSPLIWLLLGGALTFLLSKIFGRKTHEPKAANNNKDQKHAKTSKSQYKKKTKKYTNNQGDDYDDLVSYRIEFSSPSASRSTRVDDGFSSTRFSSIGNRPKTTEIKSEGNKCWIPKGKVTNIAGIEVAHGMIYVGSKLRGQKYGGADNCLINPRLKVATRSNSYDADSIGYWPSYEGLSPKARREYLKWLSGGAKNSEVNISFAFLYFYGLERRLFLEKSLEEADDILSEMRRLLEVFPNNHSLERYVENALSFATLFEPMSTSIPALKVLKKSSWQMPMNVALYIGKKMKSGEPLNNNDALLWFLNHPEKHLRTPANRLEEEFISLLQAKLQIAQPSGPKISIPKAKFNPEYSSCSSTFSTKFGKYTKGIPDISNTRAPIRAVQKLADEAMNELDKLSRLLGRSPDAKGTFKALSLLPPQLLPNYGGERISELKAWVSNKLNDKSGIFTFGEIIKKTTDNDGKKVTKAIHKDVGSMLNSLGWNMVPSPFESIGTIKPESKLLLLESDLAVFPEEKPSDNYLLAFLEVSLGAYIAHSDDRLLDVELKVLVERVKSLEHLNPYEKGRLYDVIKWLSVQKVDLGAINRKIKNVAESEKQALAELAIAVAVADGKIEPGEVRALESVYKAIGFDKKDLYSSLHSMKASAPKNKQGADSKEKKVSISSEGFKGTVELDMKVVQSTLNDTKKASALLASIFEDDELETSEETAIQTQVDEASNKFHGLDSVHAQLLTELLERVEWPREDYERLANSLKLFPDGAMEIINEWAFGKYDEAILEDGEPIEVYADLVNAN